MLENVVFEEHYRDVDYTDKSVTGKFCQNRANWLYIECFLYALLLYKCLVMYETYWFVIDCFCLVLQRTQGQLIL